MAVIFRVCLHFLLFRHFYLVSHGLHVIEGTLAGGRNLVAVDHARSEEIDKSLDPQRVILHADVLQRGTHRRNTQESSHAKG